VEAEMDENVEHLIANLVACSQMYEADKSIDTLNDQLDALLKVRAVIIAQDKEIEQLNQALELERSEREEGLEYSIIFEQDWLWTDKSKGVILEAADILGREFSRHTGLDPVTSFNRIFGVVNIRFNSTLVTLASARFSTIIFRHNEAVDLALVLHEFAHLFGVRARNKPTNQLWADKVNIKNCSIYPGSHPPSLAGYNYVEMFCNLFEIWMIGLFSLTETGVLCAEWLEDNILTWIKIILERTK
jgi:hypothetical protein